MKKITAIFVFMMLLAGCEFGAGSTDSVDTSDDSTPSAVESSEEASEETSGIKITDEIFTALSAEILCLPANNPDADAEGIEDLARNILAEVGVSEGDFSIYQQTIEADPESKNSLSLAIVGKMPEFCTLGTGEVDSEEIEETEEVEAVGEEAPETSAELEISDTEIPAE